MAIWSSITGDAIRKAAGDTFANGDVEGWVNNVTGVGTQYGNGVNAANAWREASRKLASNIKDAKGNSVLSGMTDADLDGLTNSLQASNGLATLDSLRGRQLGWDTAPGKFDGVFGANEDRSNRIASYLQTGNTLGYDPKLGQTTYRQFSPQDFWTVAQDLQKETAAHPTEASDASIRSGLGFLANSLFGYDRANRIGNVLNMGNPTQEGGYWGGLENLAKATGSSFRVGGQPTGDQPVVPADAQPQAPSTTEVLTQMLGRPPTEQETASYLQNPKAFFASRGPIGDKNGTFGGISVTDAHF